jgi:hypothetical protein
MTTYELVRPDGTPLVDISKIAADRSWRRRRNNSDSVSFKLSVDKWEETCRKLGVHPAISSARTGPRSGSRKVMSTSPRADPVPQDQPQAGMIDIQAPGYLICFAAGAPLRSGPSPPPTEPTLLDLD